MEDDCNTDADNKNIETPNKQKDSQKEIENEPLKISSDDYNNADRIGQHE